MSLFVKCAVYMALVFEGTLAFLTLFEIFKYSKIMKFDLMDAIILCVKMWKVICFSSLAVGVVIQSRLLVKLWLLWSYVQLDWAAIGSMFSDIFDYFLTDKFKTRSAFLEQLRHEYSGLVSQVLTRVGVILIVYRYYKVLVLPKHNLKMQLAQKAVQMKAN